VLITPDFGVGGIEPNVWPVALDWSGEEGLHPLVDLAAQAGDLALADALIAVGTPITGRPRTEPYGRNSRMGTYSPETSSFRSVSSHRSRPPVFIRANVSPSTPGAPALARQRR
jgi:hypothetical protein